ncbi:MaoC/PaaZ C-terminal domain-containing protein [Streptomyces sp. NPDC056796]|uniref:MaoC/PaaZ C-terminal domain-containing protein n=1 Tax=Streptomyces sp. NPDC056796 TaxID=3345947 RepID=UPI0036C1BF1B
MTVPVSRTYDEVTVGERLPPLEIPVTRTLIVATALASRDYQDVHHDPELARERGSGDVFMNILTSNGLVDRYVMGWAGPAASVQAIRVRLGAPNHPGDTMVLTGTVTARSGGTGGRDEAGARGRVEIAVRGTNGVGTHVSGTVTVLLPRKAGAR